MHADVGVRAWASRIGGGQSWSLTSSALGLDRGSRSSSRPVRASGRGVPSDVERLEEALAVALTGRDVTIDLREVEKLGPEGIAALSRASRDLGRLGLRAPVPAGDESLARLAGARCVPAGVCAEG
jgi:hypothetical protein